MGTWPGVIPTSRQLPPRRAPVQSAAGPAPPCRGREDAQRWAGEKPVRALISRSLRKQAIFQFHRKPFLRAQP